MSPLGLRRRSQCGQSYVELLVALPLLILTLSGTMALGIGRTMQLETMVASRLAAGAASSHEERRFYDLEEVIRAVTPAVDETVTKRSTGEETAELFTIATSLPTDSPTLAAVGLLGVSLPFTLVSIESTAINSWGGTPQFGPFSTSQTFYLPAGAAHKEALNGEMSIDLQEAWIIGVMYDTTF